MTKKPPKYPLPPAVPLFLAHLADIGVSQTAFCEKKGLPRIAVQRAVNGERRWFSVDFALAVKTATGGAVPVEAWALSKPKRRRAKPAPTAEAQAA